MNRQSGKVLTGVLTGFAVLVLLGLLVAAFTWALGESWSLGPIAVQGRGHAPYGAVGSQANASGSAQTGPAVAAPAAPSAAPAASAAQPAAPAAATGGTPATPPAAPPAAPSGQTATSPPAPAASATQPTAPAAPAARPTPAAPAQAAAPQQTAPRSSAPASTASPHKGDTVEKVAAAAYKNLGAPPNNAQLESFTFQQTRTPGRKCLDGTDPVHVKGVVDQATGYAYDRWHCPNDPR